MDTTQDLIGNIKLININTFYYPINAKDTIVRKEKSIVFFDSKNKIIKQINQYSKLTEETIYNYNNDILENTISNCGNLVRKIEYKYDTKKNIIEYKHIENDTIYFIKTSIYDKKNNPIRQIYLNPQEQDGKNNCIDNFEYDYKNRTVKIQSLYENNKTNINYLKTYFDIKGYIIKIESIYPDLNKEYSTYSKFEYDKLGNLIKKTSFKNDGKIIESTVYKNTFDKKGNIIIREQFIKEKLVEKATYQIFYR